MKGSTKSRGRLGYKKATSSSSSGSIQCQKKILSSSFVPHTSKTTGLPEYLEDDWRYCPDTLDDAGYAMKDDHFSDEEVSEESDGDGDGDDAKKSDVALMARKLPMAMMKIGSSDTTLTKCIHLPPHDSKGVFLLTFDGYHKKNIPNGGYGAMLRQGDDTPLAAVAGGSKHCFSAFFHILEGLQSGLDLAIKPQEIQFISFVCNSLRVSETLRKCFFSNHNSVCRQHPSDTFDVVCTPCLQQKLTSDEPIEFVAPIIREILLKGQRYYRITHPVKAHVKEWNKPADYLAKLVSGLGEEKKFGPHNFPKGLRALLNEHGGRNPFNFN